MKPFTLSPLVSMHRLSLAISLFVLPLGSTSHADQEAPVIEEVSQPADKNSDSKEADQTDEPSNSEKIKSRIILINGNKLTGEPHNLDDKGNLKFSSESLRDPAEFPLKNLLTLELETWKSRTQPESIALIEIQPQFQQKKGDTILGSLAELTPDSIKLETWYGGVVTVKRAMVKSLQIITNGPGSYFGPNNIKEWTLTDGEGSWDFHNGTLRSIKEGAIGRDVGLDEKCHISFDAKWKSSLRFRVLLYSSDISDSDPDAYYDLNFNRTSAYLKTRGKMRNGGNVARGGRWQNTRIDNEATKAHFDLFMDRKTGFINIYINGEHACILQSLSPDPSNLGTGISFAAEERYPIEISRLRISPWNGNSLPNKNMNLLIEPDSEEDKEEPPHRIILKNGDEVPGKVGKVQEGRMVVETEFTPIRIPLKRIKTLSLGDTGTQPRMYQGDVRAWFHNGGFVTLRLASLKEGRISGYGQAFGEVSFDLNAFSKIDFHPYNAEYNNLKN